MDVPINGSRGLLAGSEGESELPIRIVRSGSSPDLKLVNLALQGGGAHGAFAWGVLDRLLEGLSGNHSLDASPAFMLFDLVTRLFSPYQLNPFNYNPLRQVLTDTVDFDAVRSGDCPVKLFLSATNVRTGKIKVFQNDEIGPEAVLASACLPLMFQAVEIDGEHYWDGSYLYGQSGYLSADLRLRQP
jgi:predicted acylesterase/phospholipase RssA